MFFLLTTQTKRPPSISFCFLPHLMSSYMHSSDCIARKLAKITSVHRQLSLDRALPLALHDREGARAGLGLLHELWVSSAVTSCAYQASSAK